jgi:uncharacterized membrane protein
MDGGKAEQPHSFVFVSRRNNSLSANVRHLVFGSLVLVSLAISFAFALLGAWLILPFSGAEMAVLYAAFHVIARHAGDYESIAIVGERVLIERWVTGRVSRYELNRHWAQVVCEPAFRGWGRGWREVLALRSHGRSIEIGSHLTDEQRREMAQTLKDRLRAFG